MESEISVRIGLACPGNDLNQAESHGKPSPGNDRIGAPLGLHWGSVGFNRPKPADLHQLVGEELDAPSVEGRLGVVAGVGRLCALSSMALLTSIERKSVRKLRMPKPPQPGRMGWQEPLPSVHCAQTPSMNSRKGACPTAMVCGQSHRKLGSMGHTLGAHTGGSHWGSHCTGADTGGSHCTGADTGGHTGG